MSVTDNLLLGAFRALRARPKGDIARPGTRAGTVPAPEGAPDAAGRYLSGGEQQMLAMARAVMLNPEVILLDEPSMGLAPILVEEVFRIIQRLKEQA
jgi:branched-chain amino acid transport system ATP-binding protein